MIVVSEQCDRCSMTARFTTTTRVRSCSLCCRNEPALRDCDIPNLVKTLDLLLTELDKQQASAGFGHRQDLRGMIGRWAKEPNPDDPK